MVAAFFGCSTRWVKALANGQNAIDTVKWDADRRVIKRGKKAKAAAGEAGMITDRRAVLGLLAASPLALAGPAAAQNYPNRPIRLVVPYPAGGPTDVVARILANGLSAKLKQSVVVENRPGGAAGTVGGRVVVGAEPNGYTLLVSQVGSLTIAPSLYKLDYDPLRDLTPIAIVAVSPEILTVNPTVPANSLAEFVAYARANPGKLNFGSPGTGTLPHIIGEQLQLATGTKITHVPYRGAAPAVTDLLAGCVQLMIDSTSVLLTHIVSGKLRGLAITSERRIPQMPNVPTFAEAGYPQLTESLWTGLLAPAGTPAAVVATLNGAINDVLKTSDVQQAYARLEVETKVVKPDEFKTFMAAEAKKWAQVVSAAGIKGE
jgi:tripartite-type tricarboxylate transporter receptor subunit TctC